MLVFHLWLICNILKLLPYLQAYFLPRSALSSLVTSVFSYSLHPFSLINKVKKKEKLPSEEKKYCSEERYKKSKTSCSTFTSKRRVGARNIEKKCCKNITRLFCFVKLHHCFSNLIGANGSWVEHEGRTRLTYDYAYSFKSLT